MLTQDFCCVIIGSWSEANQHKQAPQLQEPDVRGYDPHLERTLQVSLCLLCCAVLCLLAATAFKPPVLSPTYTPKFCLTIPELSVC